jgi:arsenate reductase
MTRILFVSVRDAAASQIARALYERRGGEARSAAVRPAEAVDEAAVEALAEVGIDVSGRVPAALADGDLAWAEVVVTIAVDEPGVPGAASERWNLPDPVGLCLEEARELRSVLESRVAALPL